MHTKFIVLFLALILTACTQRAQTVTDTLYDAFVGKGDILLSPEHIEQLPYASAYVRINDGQQIFMVLGYADKSQDGSHNLKWVSSDNAMIVTNNGRIVKTLHLPNNNLAGLTYKAGSHFSFSETNRTFSEYDWQEHYRYGNSATSTFHNVGQETITGPLSTDLTEKWEETVVLNHTNSQFTNTYWVASHQVIKTTQFIGPDMNKIEIYFLKDYKE